MKKRGFVNGWQNRHWIYTATSYQRGQLDPNIPTGGSGASPNYFSLSDKGTATLEVDDVDYPMEKIYVSSPLIDDLGVYRVGVIYRRKAYNSDNCTAYTFIAQCGSDGRIFAYSSSKRTELDGAVFAGSCAKAWSIKTETGLSWNTVTNTVPLITLDGIDLTVNGKAHDIYAQILDGWRADIYLFALVLCDVSDSVTLDNPPLTTTTTTPEPNDICTRMETFKGDWVYWYGGSGQIANLDLLNSLAASYPGIYTASYIAKAKRDINGHTRVADCSFAVSYAYNIGRTNSAWFLHNYATWTGAPKNGMFLVRSGHVAIYRDGHTMEMSGIDADYQEKPYISSQWARVGYDPNRTY